jgi:hypothetical protein
MRGEYVRMGTMLAKLFLASGASIRSAATVYATLLFGSLLIISSVKAQSGNDSSAPWQNAPNEYKFALAKEQPRYFSDPSFKKTSYSSYSAQLPATSRLAKRATEALPDDYPLNDSPQGDIGIAEGMTGQCDNCDNGAGPCCAYENSCCITDDGECSLGCYPFHERLWFSGEYLMWWGKSVDLPVLASTGALDAVDTSILLGGGETSEGIHSGGRFTLGYWLNPCQDLSVEAVFLFLGNKAAAYDLNSDEHSTIVRPYYDVSSAEQSFFPVADPDYFTGSLNVNLTSELSSVELLLRRTFYQQCNHQADFLLGYRYGHLSEDLSMESSTSMLYSGIWQFSDQFSGNNEFNGAELGFTSRSLYYRWSIELLAKLALGNTHSSVRIDGSSSYTDANGGKTTYPHDGLLALPTNIGVYEQDNFSVIPELGITIGYDITCRLKATVGYTFLYWSRVVRPTDQIDTYLNSTQFFGGTLEGVRSPQPKFVITDFWAQGINLGLEYRF